MVPGIDLAAALQINPTASSEESALFAHFARAFEKLTQFGLRHGLSRDEAEDIASSVLGAVYRRGGANAGENLKLSWSYMQRAMLNTMLNVKRADKRRMARERLAPWMSRPQTPDEILIAHEMLVQLGKAIAALPRGALVSFVCVDLLGTPIDDHARALGLTRAALENRLATARRRLGR